MIAEHYHCIPSAIAKRNIAKKKDIREYFEGIFKRTN